MIHDHRRRGALLRAILALGLVLCCSCGAATAVEAHATARHQHHHHWRAHHRHHWRRHHLVTFEQFERGLADAKPIISWQHPAAITVFGDRQITTGTSGNGFFEDANNALGAGLDNSRDLALTAARGVGRVGYAVVARVAAQMGVPQDLAIAVTEQESGGNCRAHSYADARGVLQVEPYTARKDGYDPRRLYECEYGAEAGLAELRQLIAEYGGVNCMAASRYQGSEAYVAHRGGCTAYGRQVLARLRTIDRAGRVDSLYLASWPTPHWRRHHHHWANLT